MDKILNYDVYTERMRKAAQDKMWFLNMVDGCDTIVDYGCADGSLIGFMMERYPGQFRYIGVDIDEEMLRRARERFPGVLFVTPNEFRRLHLPLDTACLCCSSVVHEVYSYCNRRAVHQFWDMVYGAGFKYVAIRDMAVSDCFFQEERRWAADTLRRVRASAGTARLLENYAWVNGVSADTLSVKDMVHFLLKYRYVENWEREVRENYLPLSVDEVLETVPEGRYEVTHFEHFVLPFIREQVRRDFGVEFPVATHYKLLVRKL